MFISVARKTWTVFEKEVVDKNFTYFLQNKKLPSLDFCSKVITENGLHRTSKQLKAYINNLNKK